MLIFYLVRHGTTENNAKSKIMGQIDSPLTQQGYDEEKFLFKELKNIKLDYIYSSDLGRAFITSYLIEQDEHMENKLTSSKELREINYGDYANHDKKEIAKICPQYKTDASFVFPNGESFYQIQDRAVKFIKSLEKKHDGQTLLIVTHAAVIRSLICWAKGIDFQDNLKMGISHHFVGKFVIENKKAKSYEMIDE